MFIRLLRINRFFLSVEFLYDDDFASYRVGEHEAQKIRFDFGFWEFSREKGAGFFGFFSNNDLDLSSGIVTEVFFSVMILRPFLYICSCSMTENLRSVRWIDRKICVQRYFLHRKIPVDRKFSDRGQKSRSIAFIKYTSGNYYYYFAFFDRIE